MPAVFEDGVVSYVDLAIDLWVSVDGKQTVLDEDEFNELDLADAVHENARNGLKQLQEYFDNKKPPH
jgi:protein associated with RNAse G/E